MVKLQLGTPRNIMNMAEMTRLLREAHAAAGITVWELSRRANVKERLIEEACRARHKLRNLCIEGF
jgi:hypothetical protein